jgi:hypothetical protein
MPERFERIDARAEPAAVWRQVQAVIERRFGAAWG